MHREEACTERKAIFWHSQAALGLKSAGNRPVLLAGTRTLALRAAGKCAATASCDVVSAPEGYSRVKKPCNRDAIRGQTGKAHFVCVFWHSGGRRQTSTSPNFWALPDE